MAESKRYQSKARNRRDKENELIEELWSLLPLEMSQDAKLDKLSILRLTMAYLKCRKHLETDRSDVRECLASDPSRLPPSPQVKYVPLAMLDNDGVLVAGTLVNPELALKSSDIILPDFVLADLEQNFLSSDSDNLIDVDQKYEKLEKYKEGLERGMRAFLSQSSITPSNCCKIMDSPINNTNPLKTGQLNTRVMTSNHKKNSNGHSMCGDLTINIADAIAFLQSEKVNEGSLMLEAVPGLFLILDQKKNVLFVSENIKELLGVNQMNVIGDNISTLIYDKDFPELEKQMCDEQFLGDKDRGVSEIVLNRTFYLAMNYSFQKPKSRQKNSGQKLFRWDAKLKLYRDTSTHEIRVKGLFSFCRPIRDVSIADFQNCEVVFFTRHGMDYKCIYVDHRLRDITGYNPDNILGTDGFSLKHPCDVMMCHYKHKTLVVKGRGDSGYYRLLGRNGKWMWTISYYTVIYDQTGQPIHIDVHTYIASMEEAKCFLAREKEEYQRMKNEGFDFDLTYYGLAQPTLATLSKRKKPIKKKRSDPFVIDDEINEKSDQNIKTGNSENLASQSSASSSGSESDKTPSSETSIELSPLLSSPQSAISEGSTCFETSIELSPLLSSPQSAISEGSTCSVNVDALPVNKAQVWPCSISPLDTDTSIDMATGRDNCLQNTSSDEAESALSQDGNDIRVSNKPEPSSPLELNRNLMDEIDFTYSPLPSVNFDSPNFDVDLLMSDVSEEDVQDSDKATNLEPSLASHDDFEVQSILNYFMPAQQKNRDNDISSFSGAGHVSKYDLPNTNLQGNSELQLATKDFQPRNSSQWTTTDGLQSSDNQRSLAERKSSFDNMWAATNSQINNGNQWTFTQRPPIYEIQWTVKDCQPSLDNHSSMTEFQPNSDNQLVTTNSQPRSKNHLTMINCQTNSENQRAITEFQQRTGNHWAVTVGSQLRERQFVFDVVAQDNTSISPLETYNDKDYESLAQTFPGNGFPGNLIEIEKSVTDISLQHESDHTCLHKEIKFDDIYTLGQCYSHITDCGDVINPEATGELLPFPCSIDQLQEFLDSIDQ